MNCFCCSGQIFENCCQPFIKGIAKPPTAETLMRSRYSAYAIADVEYILRTTYPSMRRNYDRQAIEHWARSSQWEKLEIISINKGGIKDKRGMVEFKAHYLDSNRESKVHHEYSNFVKELGKWFFVDGSVA